MRRIYVCILIVSLIFNCKSGEKDNSTAIEVSENQSVSEPELNTFESQLLDFRNVDRSFNTQLKVTKFGVQKLNDSTSNFVFKLDPATDIAIAESFSYGIKSFYYEAELPLKTSFSPKVRKIDGNKYIILRNKAKDITYFDSLYVYIYERKNWKGSGELGNLKIKDILIEEENE